MERRKALQTQEMLRTGVGNASNGMFQGNRTPVGWVVCRVMVGRRWKGYECESENC